MPFGFTLGNPEELDTEQYDERKTFMDAHQRGEHELLPQAYDEPDDPVLRDWFNLDEERRQGLIQRYESIKNEIRASDMSDLGIEASGAFGLRLESLQSDLAALERIIPERFRIEKNEGYLAQDL